MIRTIRIKYNGKVYDASVVEDNKVEIIIDNEIIELDQCLKCCEWGSEDDELYGDGYCDKCSFFCETCEQYKCNDVICRIGDSNVCIDCCREVLGMNK
jgi:hypothetical protein